MKQNLIWNIKLKVKPRRLIAIKDMGDEENSGVNADTQASLLVSAVE